MFHAKTCCIIVKHLVLVWCLDDMNAALGVRREKKCALSTALQNSWNPGVRLVSPCLCP